VLKGWSLDPLKASARGGREIGQLSHDSQQTQQFHEMQTYKLTLLNCSLEQKNACNSQHLHCILAHPVDGRQSTESSTVYTMGGASGVAEGAAASPMPYALPPAVPSRREKKLYVPTRPFPSIVVA